jgi:hypothetical protein
LLLETVLGKALIRLEQWQSVLDWASTSPHDCWKSLSLYAHYRMGHYELVVQQQQQQQQHATTLSALVLAQAKYRLGDTQGAWQLFLSLASVESDPERRAELYTNALAVKIANAPMLPQEEEELTTLSQAIEPLLASDPMDHDLAYNWGTWLLLQQQPQKGLFWLVQAEQAVRTQFPQQLLQQQQQQQQQELQPILDQQAWAQGHCTSTTTSSSTELPSHPTLLQERLHHYNQAVLAFQQQQQQQQHSQQQQQLVIKHCAALQKLLPTTTTRDDAEWYQSRALVLRALIQHKQPPKSAAHQQIQLQSTSTSFQNPIIVAWIQFQVAAMEGRLQTPLQKLHALEQLQPSSLLQQPAVVATRATLRQQLKLPLPDMTPLQQAEWNFQQKQYSDAAEYFSQQDDPISQAKHVVCLSYTDPHQARKLWNQYKIPVATTTTMAVDGDALEAQPPPRPLARTATTTTPTTPQPPRRHRNRDAILQRRAKQREAYLASRTHRKPPQAWTKAAAQGSTQDQAKYNVAEKNAVVGPSTAHKTVVGDARRRRR